ncbi:MAG: hypothetical protein ACYC27_22520 [Armatimonadota bacterium]
MSHNPSPTILSKEQRRLLLLMKEINYGRIESLAIRNGNPVFDRSTKVIRYIKFSEGDQNTVQRSDLLHKPQISKFLGYINGLDNNLLELLEIKDGLPFLMNIVENLHS